MFRQIGLQIQQQKYQTTLESGVVEFMGMQFQDVMEHCKAESILIKVKESLSTLELLLDKGVSKHLILKYFESIVIGQSNSSAFVDYQQSKDTYEEIDTELCRFCQKLFETCDVKVDLEVVHNFLVLPSVSGGIQKLLPGYFFDMMN